MAKDNVIRRDLNQHQAAVVANPTRGGGQAGQRPGVLRQAAVAGVGVTGTLTLAGTLTVAGHPKERGNRCKAVVMAREQKERGNRLQRRGLCK